MSGGVIEGEALEFPCDYELKIMGQASADMPTLVVDTLAEQGLPVDRHSLRVLPSPKGNYVSVSVVVPVQSREHLQTLYATFRARSEVKWLL